MLVDDKQVGLESIKGGENMIIKNSQDSNYTKISNSAINDPNLSDKGLATLAFLMSKPEGWKVYGTQIAKRFHCDRRTSSSGLDELVKCGYGARHDKAGSAGKTSYEYDITDNPCNLYSVQKMHTINNTSLRINAEVKTCINDLKTYMDMYKLTPGEPVQTFKPQIRQIIHRGIKPKLFALYALDWMHGQTKGAAIDMQTFFKDAVSTLTYNPESQNSGKYDNCIVDAD